jgi:hypothetical protein
MMNGEVHQMSDFGEFPDTHKHPEVDFEFFYSYQYQLLLKELRLANERMELLEMLQEEGNLRLKALEMSSPGWFTGLYGKVTTWLNTTRRITSP